MQNQPDQPDSIRRSQISGGSGPPGRQGEIAEFVDLQLELLCANYANSALSAEDPRTTELYMVEIEEMTRRYGFERVVIAVREAMRCSKFLPEINVIWELIPPGPEKPGPDPDCPKCSGSGWSYQLTSPGSPSRVVKCNCSAQAKSA